MNATSALPAKKSTSPVGNTAVNKPVLVWDAPVRVFHWLMVVCFAGAYLTSESETWRLVHVTLGYTMAGMVAFRIVWGFVGTRYARFASFVRGPKAIAAYLRSLLDQRPEHHTGHNPAGALAIIGMLSLTTLIAATGWATYNEVAGEWVAELHEIIANGMLFLVGLHIAAVVISGWLHKENLARAMLTGRKIGTPGQGIHTAWGVIAALLLAAVLGFWYLQWNNAPASSIGQSDHAHPAR
jgi:cytochrome b